MDLLILPLPRVRYEKQHESHFVSLFTSKGLMKPYVFLPKSQYSSNIITQALTQGLFLGKIDCMPNPKWQMVKKGAAIIVALLVLGGTFVVGYSVGYESRSPVNIVEVAGKNPPGGNENVKSVDFTLFWDVWSRIEDKYVDRGNIDREKLVYGAISGLVKALGDPYTEFFPPQETKQFQEDIKGAFGGIGAEIGIRKGILTIISPIKDSPAERAGLKAGDKILKIDDTGTSDLSL